MDKKICPICGNVIDTELDDFVEYKNEFYCQDCFDENFTTCEECGKTVPIESSIWLDNYYINVCDDCLDSNFTQCYNCNEYNRNDEVYQGANGEMYCEECWNDRFCNCDDCGEVIWQDESYYDENSRYTYCYDCWNSRQERTIIYSYHSSRVEYIPRYLNDEDRNLHNRELYGLELEITGDTDTAERFKEIMEDDVVLMYDSSVDGYEMVTMPISKAYFYNEFVPRLTRGLRYLLDNDCTGHNGGGIHIHFKQLHSGMEVANATQILYGDEFDRTIWQAISQRQTHELCWCRMTNNEYSPQEIIEYDKLYPNDTNCHGTALNYDTRTCTHELRIFNSNLRIERVIKNMECLFALEDYIRGESELVCTTKGFMKFVDDNADDYPYLVSFLHEKNIFDKASEFYDMKFKSVPLLILLLSGRDMKSEDNTDTILDEQINSVTRL